MFLQQMAEKYRKNTKTNWKTIGKSRLLLFFYVFPILFLFCLVFLLFLVRYYLSLFFRIFPIFGAYFFVIFSYFWDTNPYFSATRILCFFVFVFWIRIFS